ncbi:putative membrane protein [Escherichia coli B102]|nr:putative membrane protein [Escherichia coli B102]
MTIRLSDNPAATPSVINILVTFGGKWISALFKVNFVMR